MAKGAKVDRARINRIVRAARESRNRKSTSPVGRGARIRSSSKKSTTSKKTSNLSKNNQKLVQSYGNRRTIANRRNRMRENVGVRGDPTYINYTRKRVTGNDGKKRDVLYADGRAIYSQRSRSSVKGLRNRMRNEDARRSRQEYRYMTGNGSRKRWMRGYGID